MEFDFRGEKCTLTVYYCEWILDRTSKKCRVKWERYHIQFGCTYTIQHHSSTSTVSNRSGGSYWRRMVSQIQLLTLSREGNKLTSISRESGGSNFRPINRQWVTPKWNPMPRGKSTQSNELIMRLSPSPNGWYSSHIHHSISRCPRRQSKRASSGISLPFKVDLVGKCFIVVQPSTHNIAHCCGGSTGMSLSQRWWSQHDELCLGFRSFL